MKLKKGDRVKTLNPLIMDKLNRRESNDFIINSIFEGGRRAHLVGVNGSHSWMIEETLYLQLKEGEEDGNV